MQINTATNLYLEHLAFRNIAENTISSYRSILKEFSDKMIGSGKTDITDVNLVDVESCIHKKELSPRTINIRVAAIRGLLKYCIRREIKTMEPTSIETAKVKDKQRNHLTFSDVLCMTTVGDIKNRCIISFLASSGVRSSELCSVKIKDITDSGIQILGKGGKARVVFIDKKTGALIDVMLEQQGRSLDSSGYLFIPKSKTGQEKPMSRQSMDLIIKKQSALAEINWKVSAHDFRHYYANKMLQNEMPSMLLKKVMGHTNLSTTEGYTNITDAELQSTYDDIMNTKEEPIILA